MEPTAVNTLGFAHFLGQTDAVGKAVLVTLVLLSIASWYLIVTRSLANLIARRKAEAFLERFWRASSLSEVEALLGSRVADNAFANLAEKSLATLTDSGKCGLAVAGGMAEYLTRTLNNEVDREAAVAEYGLTVLASAGSAAPYIGLFGTVWGIYHALVQIGLSGQGTLDKVAGPVGEALIMTALGLAVAIPAVLAYNAFNRRNRVWLAHLESFCTRPLRAADGEGQQWRGRRGPCCDGAWLKHGPGKLPPLSSQYAGGGHERRAAGRRDAGTAGDLHRHRAVADPLGEDRPAQGIEQRERHQARAYRAWNS